MTPPPVYRFADLTLDAGRRRLEREGQPIELGRLTYALLVALVESAPDRPTVSLGHEMAHCLGFSHEQGATAE